MLSEEALAIADASGNRSEYIDELILGVRKLDVAIDEDSLLLKHFKSMEQRILALLEERPTQQLPAPSIVDPLDALAAQAFVPRPPDPEKGYPCCQREVPCKHWQWDSSVGVYNNSLTGATREATQ